jgi:FkbM family methyltransferase
VLIYDVGMNNGDDTDYYLAKGARVVAIDADAELCAKAAERFAGPIAEGRLTILNIAVGDGGGEVDFFINDNNTGTSSLMRVHKGGARAVRVRLRKLSEVFAEYGQPEFAKIDVEHVDHIVLRELRMNGALPAHLSIEAHSFEVLAEIVRAEYPRVRLVNSAAAHRRHQNARIASPAGLVPYGFSPHSSGPFGEDLAAPWQNLEYLVVQWLQRGVLLGPGWHDIHAAR